MGIFDHFNIKTLKRALYEKPNIKIICGFFLVKELVKNNIDKKNIYILEADKVYDLGKYIINPVMAIHDIPNFGYKIIIKSNNYKIFHITDTSSVNHIEAKNYNWYSIEGNYESNEEIQQRITEAKKQGEFTYLDRVQESHLSQVDALNWLFENNKNNGEYIFVHQHKEKSMTDEL